MCPPLGCLLASLDGLSLTTTVVTRTDIDYAYVYVIAEGSFRRKTPRVQKPGSEDFNVYNNTAYNTYDAYNNAGYGAGYTTYGRY